jgi:hypothetical protein
LNTGTLGSLTGIAGTNAGVDYTSGSKIWKMIEENGVGYANIQVKNIIQTGTNGNSVTIQAGLPVSGYTIIWPTQDPAVDTVPMISDAGTGQMIWQAVAKLAGTNSANQIPYYTNNNTISGVTLTDGQVLIGRTGSSPLPITITGTANQVTVSSTSSAITISLPQNVHTAATPTFASMTLSGAAGLSCTSGSFSGDLSGVGATFTSAKIGGLAGAFD